MHVDSKERCIPLAARKWSISFTLVLCAIGGLGAEQEGAERTWTDVDGRTMQAEILAVEDGKVRVMIRGRESAVPLERLSPADVEFAEQWQEQRKEQEELRKAQATMFDGRQLETGGKRNLFEFEYDEEYRASLVDRFDAQDTGYRIAIGVPEGFDSTQPQKVFILANARNSQGQSRLGNVNAFNNFGNTVVGEGWVCLAYDTNLGNDVKHFGGWVAAMKKLNSEWPDFNTWMFACGGNSGGAKGAMLHTGFHIGSERNVRGLFLAGCNGAENMTWARSAWDVSKADLRDTWCFFSAKANDSKVTQQHFANVVSTLRGEGIRTIRDVWHEEEGSGMSQEHLAQALRWFAQDEP